MLREIRFTSRRPRHIYKTAKFLISFRHLQNRRVNFKDAVTTNWKNRILVLRKLFMWYYQIKMGRIFQRLFSRFFIKRRYNFRQMLGFFHLIENNLLVLLVRANFTRHLQESLFFIRSGFVFVNGARVTCSSYFVRIGDVIEILKWQNLLLIHYRLVLFFF